MGRKKKEVEIREGVPGKTCNKCSEWKSLEEYWSDKDGVGGKYSVCKVCKSASQKQEKYKEGKSERFKKHYRENKEYHKERNRKYREVNHQEKLDSDKRYREQHKVERAEYFSRWCKDNRLRRQATELRRRAHQRLLESNFPYSEQEEVLITFDGCALTGSKDIHWDHVIPLSTGHGGTTFKNMIPLRSDLNLSKGTRNIFEWFEVNRQRFELSQDKFDYLIAWLGKANNMTVEEYSNYVNWCHANKRSIDAKQDEGEAI